MAFKCGFFDSTSAEIVNGFYQGNKAQDAAFFAKREAALIGNGIYLDSFTITTGTGLTVSRSAGKAWINGYFCYDDSSLSVSLTANATHYYVLRLHLGDGEITEQWLTTYSSPVREGNVYDLLLAVVTIPNGTVNITAGMITDYRGDGSYCGYAKLQPNVNFSSIIISADEIVDSTNKFIPTKTGSGKYYLRDDGIYAPLYAKIITAASGRTLALTDEGALIKSTSGSNQTFTVPTNAAVPFAIETELEIWQYGAGLVTVGKSGGVTFRIKGTPATVVSLGQYSYFGLKKVGTDEWSVRGDIV
ncbi:MAG: hypothetical protein ACYCWE_20305 [Eubacteriales bacterium]